MNLGQTGLLPEKREETSRTNPGNDYNWGYNTAIDQIAQIPFDPVKYVEIDIEILAQIFMDNDFEGTMKYPNKYLKETYREKAKALASAKDRWMKEVIR